LARHRVEDLDVRSDVSVIGILNNDGVEGRTAALDHGVNTFLDESLGSGRRVDLEAEVENSSGHIEVIVASDTELHDLGTGRRSVRGSRRRKITAAAAECNNRA